MDRQIRFRDIVITLSILVIASSAAIGLLVFTQSVAPVDGTALLDRILWFLAPVLALSAILTTVQMVWARRD